MKKKIKLGQTVRDKITGFEGIVIGITEWMNGCTRLGIKSQTLKDGKPINAEWFDEPDLEVVKKKSEGKVEKRGGPRDDPSSRRSGE